MRRGCQPQGRIWHGFSSGDWESTTDTGFAAIPPESVSIVSDTPVVRESTPRRHPSELSPNDPPV
jgi:hypothetical protein